MQKKKKSTKTKKNVDVNNNRTTNTFQQRTKIIPYNKNYQSITKCETIQKKNQRPDLY